MWEIILHSRRTRDVVFFIIRISQLSLSSSGFSSRTVHPVCNLEVTFEKILANEGTVTFGRTKIASERFEASVATSMAFAFVVSQEFHPAENTYDEKTVKSGKRMQHTK